MGTTLKRATGIIFATMASVCLVGGVVVLNKTTNSAKNNV